MADYVAYFFFGASSEMGPISLRSATPDEYLCSETFQRVVSQWRISFATTPQYLAARVVATGDTIVRILKDNVLVFQGRVPPTDGWISNGIACDGSADLSDIELEVLDYSAWLDGDATANQSFAVEDFSVCDPSSPGTSLVHKLLALRGISGSLFVAVATETTLLHAFALEEGENVADKLDSLLFQYGLVLRWVTDHFETWRWLIETPIPTVDLDEDLVLTGLETQRVEREADGVEVKWYALKDKASCLLYMADLPFGDDNQRSGYPIQAGLLWPEEANPQAGTTDLPEVYWDYDDTALSSKASSSGSRKKNTDFTQLVLTKNHRVDAKFDSGIIEAFSPIFQNKRARLAYSNPTAASLDIYYCDIYADVIYRGAENSVCKNTIGSPKNTKPITAEFLHDIDSSTRLACALADQYGTACWRYTARSETRLELGTIVTLRDPYSGLTTIAVIRNRQHNAESEIYTYKLLSLGPVTIVPTASYQAILPEPKTANEDPRQQAQRATPGAQGESAYAATVTSTEGLGFDVGQSKTTILAARVWHGGQEVTEQLDASCFCWRRDSGDVEADAIWNSNHRAGYKTLIIVVNDPDDTANYFCDISQ